MNLCTVLFVFPFLSSPAAQGLPLLVEAFPDRRAADSAIALLRRLPDLEGPERDVARLLLAIDLGELGLEDAARTVLRSLSGSPAVAGPAFLSLARLDDETSHGEALFHAAKTAPWDRLDDADFGEACYRVARAAFRTERYPDAREWARRVPAASPYFPFARYLLAQSEYALGRYARAVEAAEAVFSSQEPAGAIDRLQERTAVLLGDMFIEIGLYTHAIDVLAWPDAESPYRERARRDLAVARGLAMLAVTRFDQGEAETARATALLDGLAEHIATTVDTEEEIAERAAALKSAWPSERLRSERRRWAAKRASAALDGGRGWSFGRVLAAAWESFPPVVLYRLIRHEPEPVVPAAELDRESGFFFAPSPAVSRLLAAVAILESRDSAEGDCASRAADALRTVSAAALVGERPAPTAPELAGLAAGCGEGRVDGLLPIAERRLRESIAAEAHRLHRDLRRHRFALDEAIARARLDHQAAVRATEGSR